MSLADSVVQQVVPQAKIGQVRGCHVRIMESMGCLGVGMELITKLKVKPFGGLLGASSSLFCDFP